MKLILISFVLLFCLPITAISEIERKVDAKGNEYFIAKGSSLEAKNKTPPTARDFLPLEKLDKKIASPAFKQIALEMKSGCTATTDIGKPGAAVVPLDDIFVVIPTGPNGLPPHPGEKGKLTIHGVDSDDDCVRDDIEHYIVGRFGEKDQTTIRKYLFEYAIWLDFFLIQGLSEDGGRTGFRELAEAGTCLSNLIGTGQSSTEINELFAEFHNTFDRSHRYADNLPTIAGWTSREGFDAECS